MQKVYLDNAATTPLHPSVIEEMVQVMQNNYGNPSSTHVYGREAKALIELSRKKIATLLNVSPAEIFSHHVEPNPTIPLFVHVSTIWGYPNYLFQFRA